MENKNIIIFGAIFLIVGISTFLYLYFLPNPIFPCTEITGVKFGVEGKIKTIDDRAETCLYEYEEGKKYAGYNSFNACMFYFDEFAKHSSDKTGYKCTKREFLIKYNFIDFTRA